MVEDNYITQKLVGTLLENEGHTVEFAVSGDEAIDLAKRIKPALILMDIGLPGADGIAVTRMIKSDNEIEDIPVIMLSGHATKEDRRKAADAGVADFITKPFGIGDFADIVRRTIIDPNREPEGPRFDR